MDQTGFPSDPAPATPIINPSAIVARAQAWATVAAIRGSGSMIPLQREHAA